RARGRRAHRGAEVKLVAALRARASLVAIATIAALAFGAHALTRLASGIYPEVDFPRLVVVARVGDLPPEAVQTAATRQLEEALATGADPLHLAAVFGFSDGTAIRWATNAQQLIGDPHATCLPESP
ncbi:MAG TPA: hypothetical protein VGP91_13570, partial [Actinoplanes sp.]|nr:hypothetical protein [Actinoplanes sp.]